MKRSFCSSGNVSSEIQLFNLKYSTFDGRFGKDQSLLQPSRSSDLSLKSWEMLSGKEMKSFPLRRKAFKKDKQPISLGIAERLQSLKSKSFISKHGNERNNTPIRSWLVSIGADEDDGHWHPLKHAPLSLLRRMVEKGSSLIAVPCKRRDDRLTMFPKFSGKFLIF